MHNLHVELTWTLCLLFSQISVTDFHFVNTDLTNHV